mmetsp:Transcript_27771/g.67541  ORF Transcript_27771/g.67541 Transcript_27771/m.67541 type:complete len:444 (+) Transcript_27771:212-1543(+)
MAWRCSGTTNRHLCLQLKNNEIIKSPEVEAAFLATDRKHFCPKPMHKDAYDDRPIRHGHVHMSAPHIYASTLETLELKEGNKFLCIGSGSGYFCTLVGHLIGPTGIVHGIEIFEDVVRFAQDRQAVYRPVDCNSLKLEAMGANQGDEKAHSSSEPSASDEKKVEGWFKGHSPDALAILQRIQGRRLVKPQYIVGNCFELEPDNNIRYDRIYVAAGAPRSMAFKLSQFLEIGGFLVGPFDDSLLKVTRRSETNFSEELKAHVRFSPLLNSLEDKAGSVFSESDSDSPAQDTEITSPGSTKKRQRVESPRGVLSFSPVLWSPRSHAAFPRQFKNAVIGILILQKRKGCIMERLPLHTWFYIFEFMNRDWFHVEMTEIELLKQLLANETRARKEAEARAAKAERERDRAMMIALCFPSREHARGNQSLFERIRGMGNRGETEEDEE